MKWDTTIHGDGSFCLSPCIAKEPSPCIARVSPVFHCGNVTVPFQLSRSGKLICSPSHSRRKVILGCYKENLASAATIQKNGGTLIAENENYKEGRTSQYYLIPSSFTVFCFLGADNNGFTFFAQPLKCTSPKKAHRSPKHVYQDELGVFGDVIEWLPEEEARIDERRTARLPY